MSVPSKTRRALCLAGILLLACRRGGTATPAATLAPLRFGFIGVGEAQPVGAEGFAFKHGDLAARLAELGFERLSFVGLANEGTKRFLVTLGLAQRDFERMAWAASSGS